jgi:DNA-binding transcriptional ArsR family regulator
MPSYEPQQPVRVLTIDVASSAQWMNKTAGFFRDPGESRTYISFIDPATALRFMNDRRFQIVQLLVKEGPLTAAAIAVRLRRSRMMLERDLEALFEGEVIERDREQRYFYEFDGIRILLQWPLPDDSDAPRGRGSVRHRPGSCRRKPFRRSRPRGLPMLRRRQYREPESAQAVLAPDIPKMDQTVDRKTISRILLVGGILAVASMVPGFLMQHFS